MEQRRFGDSDLKCSALGFGTWELSTTDYGEIDVKEAQRAAQEAIDHGITLFDTAEAYGPYHSEELLGKALAPPRAGATPDCGGHKKRPPSRWHNGYDWEVKHG